MVMSEIFAEARGVFEGFWIDELAAWDLRGEFFEELERARVERLDGEGAVILGEEGKGGALEGEFVAVGLELDEERDFAGNALEDFGEEGDLGVIGEFWQVGAGAIGDWATVGKGGVMINDNLAVFEEADIKLDGNFLDKGVLKGGKGIFGDVFGGIVEAAVGDRGLKEERNVVARFVHD